MHIKKDRIFGRYRLVERAQDENDLCVLQVQLTQAGRRAEKVVRKVWMDVENKIIGTIPDEMLEKTHEILRQIRNGLGGEYPRI